jgi:ABC-type transport system involved in multi-copper enzyme maturation permease subunit
MQFWALVVDSLRESLDRKIFWVLIAITLLIVAAMICVGFESDRVNFFFGLWDLETDHMDPLSGLGRSRIVGLVVYLLMDMFLGWIGVILMIIATAGVFPAFMERGAIDVLLSKPMSRHRLFLYKYLASMVFVLLQASLFVVLTFLVMGLRWGVWVPGYLLSIPLLVLLFSYVYCVSVLVAVKTRSTVAAILLSVGAWVLYICPGTALQVFDSFPSFKEHERLYQAVRVASWIPPKTAEVPYLAANWAGAGTSIDVFPSSMGDMADQESIEQARKIEERELRKSPVYSIGSSLLFEAAIVIWAMCLFARKDY